MDWQWGHSGSRKQEETSIEVSHRNYMSWMTTIKDLFAFICERKKFVLAPLVIILVLMAVFILLAEIPVLTPFIYALF